MMIYNTFDIVEVPFPFSDIPKSKRRKALVISSAIFNEKNENTVMMMITSALQSKWFLDVDINKIKEAGLKKKCVVRHKLFTLDNNLILRRCGHLSLDDQKRVITSLIHVFPIK